MLVSAFYNNSIDQHDLSGKMGSSGIFRQIIFKYVFNIKNIEDKVFITQGLVKTQSKRWIVSRGYVIVYRLRLVGGFWHETSL